MIRPILKFGDQPLHQPAADVREMTADVQRLIEQLVSRISGTFDPNSPLVIVANYVYVEFYVGSPIDDASAQ